jgi:hypothetical protein
VGFLGGFFAFFGWVFYCQPCLPVNIHEAETGGAQRLVVADLDPVDELGGKNALAGEVSAHARHVQVGQVAELAATPLRVGRLLLEVQLVLEGGAQLGEHPLEGEPGVHDLDEVKDDQHRRDIRHESLSAKMYTA